MKFIYAARVCSAHFDELCYRKVSFVDELAGTPRNSRPLNRDAVPYTFPGNCGNIRILFYTFTTFGSIFMTFIHVFIVLFMK